MLTRDKLSPYFFFGTLLVVLVLVFFTLRPFLNVLALAAVGAVVLQPLYRVFLRGLGGREKLSSLLVLLVLAVVLLVPLFFLSFQLFGEAKTLYSAANKFTDEFLRPLEKFLPSLSFDLTSQVGTIVSRLIEYTGRFLSGTIGFILNTLLWFAALFFFIKDGRRWADKFVILSPLSDRDDREILSRLNKTINAVVLGTLLVALLKGLAAGFGFLLFAVPNVTLLGALTAVSSLIPGIGTALVIIPAVIYLWFSGNIVGVVGLTIWGVLLVGLLDNVLTPIFYARGTKAHPLFMFFAVLGGLAFFGPAGFILGPVLLSLFYALLEIYLV